MQENLSRRRLIATALALVAAGVAGCTKGAQALRDTTSTAAAPTAPDTVGSGSPLAASRTSRAGGPATSGRTPSGVTRPAPSSAPAHTGPAVEIASGPANRRRVALTFHGAGEVALARQILQIAQAKHAHITVLVVGTWLAENPHIAAEILAGGHELGNHTWSHQDINSMTQDGMRQEVTRCRDLLEQTAGTPGSYFRQSQSPTATDQLKRVAGAAGYRVCLSYSLDSMDWTDPGTDAVRSNTAAATAGSIVSMHLGHRDTVEALPGILDDLAARGLSAVTVSALLAP